MKKLFPIIFQLLICAIPCAIYAQRSASSEELSKHNLRWITSNGDFDQTGWTNERIDTAMAGRINRATNTGTLTMDIQIPINTAKLNYLGYLHPNSTGLFDNNNISSGNAPELNKMLHIYKYGDFYISTESDGAVDQQNVYYAIRAIHILKVRYPETYKKLFSSTLDFATQTPRYNPWVNANKAFWIAFNTNPSYIASNRTILQAAGNFPAPNNTVSKYKNIALVNINSRNILGDLPTIGSRPIYNKAQNGENYEAYMKEGLIESINHEMGHNYIDLSFSYDDLTNKIVAKRGMTNFNLAEENAILNTSISYFMKKGGFTDSLSKYYYRETFEPNINAIKQGGQLEDYAHVFSTLDVTDQNLKQIFKLFVLD